jgi:hypothetical protein
MPSVGFQITIPASERAKTVHASDRSATDTGLCIHTSSFFLSGIIRSVHLICLELTTVRVIREEQKLRTYLNFSQSSFLRSKYSPQHLILNNPQSLFY